MLSYIFLHQVLSSGPSLEECGCLTPQGAEVQVDFPEDASGTLVALCGWRLPLKTAHSEGTRGMKVLGSGFESSSQPKSCEREGHRSAKMSRPASAGETSNSQRFSVTQLS
ncbi:Protein of unknown function [Gryllus bimaculatus]|nr:Protein of unknown function [Gryllus bimaculatus]